MHRGEVAILNTSCITEMEGQLICDIIRLNICNFDRETAFYNLI